MEVWVARRYNTSKNLGGRQSAHSPPLIWWRMVTLAEKSVCHFTKRPEKAESLLVSNCGPKHRLATPAVNSPPTHSSRLLRLPPLPEWLTTSACLSAISGAPFTVGGGVYWVRRREEDGCVCPYKKPQLQRSVVMPQNTCSTVHTRLKLEKAISSGDRGEIKETECCGHCAG